MISRMLRTNSPLLSLTSVAAILVLIIHLYNVGVYDDLRILRWFAIFGLPLEPPKLFPYHHVIDQMEWITEFATNKVCFIVLYRFLFFNACIPRERHKGYFTTDVTAGAAF